jgi:hypothetical protein
MESSRVKAPPSNDAPVQQQQDPGFQKREASRLSRAFLINSLLPRAPKQAWSRLFYTVQTAPVPCFPACTRRPPTWPRTFVYKIAKPPLSPNVSTTTRHPTHHAAEQRYGTPVARFFSESSLILGMDADTAKHECVSEDALQHLKTYKYSSVDKSFISRYILKHYVRSPPNARARSMS